MTGAEFLAQVLATGRAFDIAPGTSLAEAEAALGQDYVEELHGSPGRRLLRRDYGFTEVTFGGEPEWSLYWMSLEVHRLACHMSLIDELRDLHGIDFSRYTTWKDVKIVLVNLCGDPELRSVDEQQGYSAFSANSGRALIRVVCDPSWVRDDLPGDGDVWGLELRSASRTGRMMTDID